MCKCVKVHAEVSVIESDDTAKAISDEIFKASCDGLVIGASRNGLFSWKNKGRDLSSAIARSAPSICTVYIISGGKLKYLRPADACRFPRTLQKMSRSSASTSSSSRCTSYIVGAPSLSSSHDQASLVTFCKSCSNQMQNLIEIQLLKGELQHVQELLAKTENETCDATRQTSELFEQQLEEKMSLMEIIDREEKAKELAKLEREKAEAASRAAHKAWESAQKEAYQRKYAQQKAIHEVKEAEKLKTVFMVSKRRYQHFTKEEIVSATSSLSPSLRIGSGSFGTVYKCELHHTTMAVKILHSEEDSESKQFHQELEILSGVFHPHLLLLLGACIDHNGNLEDMLLQESLGK